MAQLWVVRVVLFPNDQQDNERNLVECFRRMRIISVVKDTTRALVFDIYPPRAISVADSKRWADTNAEMMRSFQLNAQAAPAGQGVTGEVV